MSIEEYNNYIRRFIKELIEEKDLLSEEISSIATFINHEEESQDLDNFDIQAINIKRNCMESIYQLIEDLDKLIKKEN